MWQEHGAAHAGGPRAQQAGKLETRALFAGSQGGTVARAGGNTCGPQSARLNLRSRGRPHRTIYLARRRFRVLSSLAEVVRVGSRRARVGHEYQLLRLTLERKGSIIR